MLAAVASKPLPSSIPLLKEATPLGCILTFSDIAPADAAVANPIAVLLFVPSVSINLISDTEEVPLLSERIAL